MADELEREFEPSYQNRGNDTARLNRGAAVSPESKFDCSKTIGLKGGGGRTGTALWLLGLVAFVVSAFLAGLISQIGSLRILASLILYLGIAIWCLASIAGAILMFTGVPNFFREGPCPRCNTRVKLISEDNRSAKCPGCKRQMLLRGNKIYDVS